MHPCLVIGASRGIGLEVVRQASAQDRPLRAMARSGGPDLPNIDWVQGDATQPADLHRALQSVQSVIMTLGLPNSPMLPFRPVTLFSKATEALLPAMAEAQVRRLVVVTGIGAGDSRSALSSPEKLLQKSLLGPAYRDKDVQEQMIRASDTDWTLVRPTILTNRARSGRYHVLIEPKTWRNGLISRADVADFLLKAVDDTALIGQAPVITR